MITHEKLLHLYPDYQEGDWELIDHKDGKGAFIAKWNRADRRPTKAELDAVTPTQETTAKRQREVKDNFELSKKDKVIIQWIADRTGGATPAQIRSELWALWLSTS